MPAGHRIYSPAELAIIHAAEEQALQLARQRVIEEDQEYKEIKFGYKKEKKGGRKSCRKSCRKSKRKYNRKSCRRH